MRVSHGYPTPLGPSLLPSLTPNTLTVNIAIHANLPSLSLILFPPTFSIISNPSHIIPFPALTGSVFHICLHDIPYDSSYTLYTPSVKGRLLSDPHAKWLKSSPRSMWMQLEGEQYLPGKDKKESIRAYISSFDGLKQLDIAYPFRPCRVAPPKESLQFDWEHTTYPKLPHTDVVIYEAHVRALTKQGTFRAACDRISYLKWLGITAVQLMPIFEFAETEYGALDGDFGAVSGEQGEKSGEERGGNMWGYSPLSWFSPMNRYAEEGECRAAVELKALIRELHKEGMECYLDVVYNHSSNSSCALHFLGVQDEYYVGERKDGRFCHTNFSGCGNTLACNKVMMENLVVESLKWWVAEYKVDGFRLDAAGILCRDETGKPLSDPGVVKRICREPMLKDTKFIVEGWDAGDQIGSPNFLWGKFPYGERISEWNAEFRDVVRRYFRGDGEGEMLCRAIRGSPHLFGEGKKVKVDRPLGGGHSVNFVACHDGFCLADVVSFEKRVNKDGYDEVSFNCGVEGVTEDVSVKKVRARQVRNLLFVLVVSRGVPMIYQGDEFGWSKQGNSNPYYHPLLYTARLPDRPQDCEQVEGLVRFVSYVLKLRRETSCLRGGDFFAQLCWLDENGKRRGRERRGKEREGRAKKGKAKEGKARMEKDGGGLVAFWVEDRDKLSAVYVAMNSKKRDIEVCLPWLKTAGVWAKVVDTNWTAWDQDVQGEELGKAPKIAVTAQSCVLCVSKQSSG